ncbi:AMP-dependent synthetase [Streptomyces spiroverticillatus]|uniref:AMP-dependent synthetase n=1 Tax=Streptomyces finlayi TaxID=67296 RepID=A0A918WZ20_9ACTN|nr:AMP-dependent synthetase/ligase [Streptomyces finlayi]GHA14696.1 AMP-dependent synthetase [Streptomyces spiroverticillatus]GHC97167.1 AMP-dependent synthetase [Streptomyces finlayi]
MTTILRLPAEPAELTLPALLLRNTEDHGDLPALSWRTPDGGWTTLTWREVRRKAAVLAAGYAALGVRRGEQVLMMMGNRPEHWLSDLALTHLGAIPVSVYGTAAAEQVAHIVRHSGARFAIVEGAGELPRWEPLLTDTSNRLEKLVVAEPAEAGPHRTYGSLHASGGRLHQPDAFEKTWRETRAEDVLTVVYTSGTTGDPKAVPITHRMVVSNALSLDKVVALPDHVEHICYLPFAHIAERMLGIYLPVFRASHVHLCADVSQVAATARELHPAQFFGVPRVWEKMAAGVRAALAGLPVEQRAAIERMGETTRAHIAARERGEVPSPELETAHTEAKKGLAPLLALAGFDRLVWTASASAPMPLEVTRFWAGLGITIMDAWGLTETVGVCTANSPTDGFRLGSVGRPLDGLELKVAEDGEILARGETVFRGYLRADGTLEEALDADGWFATGDIGRIDDDGFLWLTDRKKEMIVTSTGKNVSPALVENTLKEHPLIGQALVHGDGKSYVVALLVPDAEVLPAWAAAQGIEGPVTAGHPAVREEIARAVQAANARLNRTEQVKRYRVLADEWGPETGELTPSLKLRRRAIREKYGAEIEALYG